MSKFFSFPDMKDLMAYKIHSRYPFEIEECSIGTGRACGAVQLEDGFIDVLRKRLGKYATSILTERRVADATRHFEHSIKRQFNPLDDCCDDTYEVPFLGAPDLSEIGLEAGYLILRR